MGTGSPVDFTNPAADRWWRESARRLLSQGVHGIKADDGEGYYLPEHVRLADGRTGAQAAWGLGGLYRRSMQRALDEAHPDDGVLFGRSGWTGQHAVGMTWAGDQASDFWSLRVLVAALLNGALSGFSNVSHDIGGYLGHRLVERCPPELLVRWLQVGCFTPLMHAHGRMPQEPWRYGAGVMDLYRGYAVLHEQLVPYVRAAALSASVTGLPIIRPLCLVDPGDARGWSIADAYGYGPALWVAPVLEAGAREREVMLPAGEWIESGPLSACTTAGRWWCRLPWSGSPCGCGRGRSWCRIRLARWRTGWGLRASFSVPDSHVVGTPAARTGGGQAGRRHADRLAAPAVVGL